MSFPFTQLNHVSLQMPLKRRISQTDPCGNAFSFYACGLNIQVNTPCVPHTNGKHYTQALFLGKISNTLLKALKYNALEK